MELNLYDRNTMVTATEATERSSNTSVCIRVLLAAPWTPIARRGGNVVSVVYSTGVVASEPAYSIMFDSR